MATLTDTDPGMVGKGLNAVGGAINKTFDAVLPGYKTARLSGEEDLKQKQLETRIMQWQEKHNQALPYLARAKKRIQSGDLDGYIDDMKHVHNVFPDGEEILDKKKRADGVVVTIRNRDGTKRQELINYQTAQQDWEDAYAGMDPQAFLRTQSQLYAEREAFNRVQKQKPQETVDGTYAYQQMDDKGNFVWMEKDKDGNERQLKSKPKLLAEQSERRRFEQDLRKGEADIAAKEASAEKDRAYAEYTRGGKGRSKEPTESYPGEHSDKISKGIYENFGVTAGPDKDGNISSYNLDTKNAVDKDLASRGRIGLWKPRKKGWGGGIEYEFMGHTEGPKEGDVGTFGDREGNTYEAVFTDGKWVKKGADKKTDEEIPDKVIERVEESDEPAEEDVSFLRDLIKKQYDKSPLSKEQKEKINRAKAALKKINEVVQSGSKAANKLVGDGQRDWNMTAQK